ncbi:MAG: transposase [Candidatus Acetothermia bacterium]|nr:transposase [Candidatus Acetothermia bacterium]
MHREIGRRCGVVGMFPNIASVLRLIGAGKEVTAV